MPSQARATYAWLPAYVPLLLQALGLKPKSAPSTHTQPALEKHEVERLLKGGGGDDDAAAGAEADRMKGLGFNAGYASNARCTATGIDNAAES